MGRHIIVQQEKILRAECSWTNPINALQEAIHYSFIKFCIYCFSLWYEFFVCYTLRVKTYYQHGLDAGPLEFQFLQPRGCLTNPFRTHFVSGSFGKHLVSSPVIILLKKLLSPLAIVIMSWQEVTRSSLRSSVKECGTKCSQLSLSQILFQNLKNYSLGDVQRFCYHSWCDLTVIFDQISNSSNVYLSSSRFWMATSLVIFSQLPSVSKSRTPPKNFWSVQSLIPVSLCTNTGVSVTDGPALKQSFMATLCSFLPSTTY